jgi:hypothetical protein
VIKSARQVNQAQSEEFCCPSRFFFFSSFRLNFGEMVRFVAHRSVLVTQSDHFRKLTCILP